MEGRRRFLIYVYLDPRTWEVFYVGKSSNGMARAFDFSRHYSFCKNTLLKLKRFGLRPVVRVVQEFPDTIWSTSALNDAEVFWIGYFRSLGCLLTNCTNGGEISSDEVKERIRQKNVGQRRSLEARRKMSEAAKARGVRPGWVEEMRLINLGKKRSVESREKIRQKALGRKLDPETRKKISETLKSRVKTETIER